jgi:hypothetical protein
MRKAAVPVVLLAALTLATGAACRTESIKARGESAGTVSGAAGATFADATAAKTAFTRVGGPMTAILQDAAWIRLEPDPERAEERYPDYFRGFTTIDVVLRTKAFVQPTKETYLLEDSTGARVTTKPESYRGDTLRDFGPKNEAVFTLVFPHVLSKDATWLRLTREGAEGGVVTWDMTR